MKHYATETIFTVTCPLKVLQYYLGSLSNNDRDGRENVTCKVISRCLKLHRSYFNSFNLSNVDCFSGVDSKRLFQNPGKENEVLVMCSRSPQNVKLGSLRRSCAVTAKKCTKKRDARAN